MKLLVIRHGETAANAARILQHPHEPLSSRGIQQAERLAKRLRNAGLSLIISSDYERARMTATAISRASGATLEIEPLLRERNFGAWRGSPYAILSEDPLGQHVVPPEGETWDVFHERAADAFAAVIARAERAAGPVAVVTHGLVCKAFVHRHLALGGESYPQPWSNTSITEAEGPPWKLLRINCAQHLEGFEAGDEIAPA